MPPNLGLINNDDRQVTLWLDRAWRVLDLQSTPDETAIEAVFSWQGDPPNLVGQPFWHVAPRWLAAAVATELCAASGNLTNTTCFEAFVPEWNGWAEISIRYCCTSDDRSRGEHIELCIQPEHWGTLALPTTDVDLELLLGGQLLQEPDSERALQACVTLLQQNWDMIAVAVWTYNPALEGLELRALVSQDPECSVQVLASPRLSLARPLTDWENDPTSMTLQTPPARVTLLWLVVAGRPVGALGLWDRLPRDRAAHEQWLRIGQLLALAIDRYALQRALSHRPESFLLSLADKLREAIDLDQILDIGLQEVRSLLVVDRCLYLWCWPESGAVTAGAEVAGPMVQALPLGDLPMDVAMPLAAALRSGCDWLMDTTHTGPAPLGAAAWLLVPVRHRLEGPAQSLDSLLCLMETDQRVWSEEHVILLQGAADQIAIAIDRSTLIEQTRAAARAAQTQAHQLERAIADLKQTQARLIQTEKMSSLGQVVAGIAHEINNPTSFISGNLYYANEYAQTLMTMLAAYDQSDAANAPEIRALRQQLDLDYAIEDWPNLLASMTEGTHRIQAIVTSLKQFSHLDRAEVQWVDLRQGLENTLLVLGSRLSRTAKRQAPITINRNYAENTPLLECYASQLNQVFLNLLGNAIDALADRPEGAMIQLRICPCVMYREKGGGPGPKGLLLQIRDNGCGMDRAARARAFDPFFTTKPIGQGTGLGLAVAYQVVVEQHAGRLLCHSRPGCGTRVTLVLPITLAHPPAEVLL